MGDMVCKKTYQFSGIRFCPVDHGSTGTPFSLNANADADIFAEGTPFLCYAQCLRALYCVLQHPESVFSYRIQGKKFHPTQICHQAYCILFLEVLVRQAALSNAY